MDPTANLAKQRELAAVDWTGKETEELSPSELCELHINHIRLCELVEGLDQWISKGGFLPKQWGSRKL